MKKRRPFGITILAMLIGLGALVAIYHMLQFLRVIPFTLGTVSFYAYDLLGAILWGVDAAILIWVASSLWNLGMEGRLFVLVIATLNLILAFISILGGSSLTAMAPAILINTIILIYCLLPGVEKSFLPASEPKPASSTCRGPGSTSTCRAPGSCCSRRRNSGRYENGSSPGNRTNCR